MPQTNDTSTAPGHYIRANGLDIYYEETGTGRPLILLHGGTESSRMWQSYLPAFIPHFRVITPDSRAHGKTINPSGELSYHLMAEDVAAFTRALNLVRPLVCGYSDGGQIALALGMDHPGLAGALVVGAAWYKFSGKYLAWLKAAGFEGPGLVNFKKIQKDAPEWVDSLKAEHARSHAPGYWQTLLLQLSTMWWTDLQYSGKDFQRITDPTLILMGDRDETNETEQALEMSRLIQNAELSILPNASHMSPNPRLLTETVLDFLLRQTPPADPA